MLARELMTFSPVAAYPEDSISHVARLMRDWDVGIVPVIDDPTTKRLVGVITDRDIAVRCVAPHEHVDCTVDAHMTATDLMTVYPETSVAECERVMTRSQVRRLPVVDADGRLVGMLSFGDLVRHVDRARAAELLDTIAAISQPVGV
ncbi:MAG TPA: CBS domain-containing protein [Gemmatimonadaceae bacterium]|nr:CBS domain-containing protein [Gemmatimonadaceae bacterium]